MLLSAELVFLAWMKGFDVFVLAIVSVVTIALEIDPGRRLSSPLIARSRASALGAGYAFGRSEDISHVSVLASLNAKGHIAFEDSIYLNPVAKPGRRWDAEDDRELLNERSELSSLSLSSGIRGRLESLDSPSVALGFDTHPEIVFVPVELSFSSAYHPDPGTYVVRCFLPNGFGEWFAELVSLQQTSDESSSLKSYHYMALYSLVIREYYVRLRAYGAFSQHEPEHPVVQR